MEATTQVLDREEITATPGSAAKLIREVRAKTRRQFSAEDKIRIVHHKQFQLIIQKSFDGHITFIILYLLGREALMTKH